MRTAAAPPARPARARGWLAPAALIAAVLAAFGVGRRYGFLDSDDGDYVFRNLHLLQGSVLERLRWAFSSFHAANWHPLTWLSFMADGALFGLDPGWCHAENLLLHAVNAALVFGLFARLTGSPGKSALAAALFALHPLRVESVAWVTERKGLLMAFFSLLTLHSYTSYVRRPARGRSLAVVGLCACALLAKPQAVALPLVLLVVDWWPLGRIGSRAPLAAWAALVRQKLPLFLLAAAATALTVAAQRQGAAVASLEALPLGERLASAVVAPVAYLAKTLWPAGLSPVYPFAHPPGWQVAGALLALAGVTAAAVRWRSAQPWLAAGWLSFLLWLAPVSNLFQAGGQSMADRYTYLPHVPLAVATVWSSRWLLRNRPGTRRAAVGACLLLALAGGIAARRQAGFWRDDLTLFSHALAVTKDNWKMHYNLGNTLDRQGRWAEAQEQYLLALAARPDYAEALNNLGALYGRRGESARAASLFSRAVSAHPGYGPGWFNLAFQCEQAGDLGGALRNYARAAALQPGAAEPRVREGRVLLRLGRREEAAVACREAQRLDPASAGAAACLAEAAAPPGAASP